MKRIVQQLLTLTILSTCVLFSHKQSVHQHITREAFKLLLKSYPFLANSPMATYIGNSETNSNSAYYSWGDGTIASGSWIEDEYDIAYHYGIGREPVFSEWIASAYVALFPGGNRTAFTSITHFWNADGGINSPSNLSDMADGISWSFSCENAMQKMYKFYNGDFENRWLYPVRGWDCSPTCEYISLGSDMQMSNLINIYRNALSVRAVQHLNVSGHWETPPCIDCPTITYPVKYVYEQLGRMCHLLEDMSVPAHVHTNSHACTHGMYCDYYENIAETYHLWTADEIYAAGGTFISPYYSQWGDPLYYLMYLVNQATDHYASGRSDGDNNYDINCPGLAQIIAGLGLPTTQGQINDANCRAMHDKLFPLVIRATAGLLYWFAREAGLFPPTVSISGPTSAPCATGTWTANVSSGLPPFTYKWWQQWDCGGGASIAGRDGEVMVLAGAKSPGGGPVPNVPCNPTWNPVGTNSPTLQFYLCCGNAILKVDVTDALGRIATDEHYVVGNCGGGGPAEAVGNSAARISSIPNDFMLAQNFPNPFNPETEIQFGIPEHSIVRIVISDLLGREIVTLVEGQYHPGTHRSKWMGYDSAGNKVGSGTYFYQIFATGESGRQFSQIQKMILMK